MPSRKVITTTILCLSAVVSIWLIQRTPTGILKQTTKNTVSVVPFDENIENTNTDWKKLLVSIDKKPSPIEDLTKNNDSEFDDTTVTAQMSRDFMSQYLLLKKGGRELTQEDLNRISMNVISSPQYNKIDAPVYLTKNLHISQNNDIYSLRKYRDSINLILKNRSLEIKNNPLMVLNASMKTNDSSLLDRLNIIVDASNGLIHDFLAVEVPSSAVNVHLSLMNSVSNIAITTESMKELYNDPVKAMIGLSQYNTYIASFQKSLTSINSYLAGIK